MSRINAVRGRRTYRRDARGRFAKTGSASNGETKTGPSTSATVARAVGITALSLAGAAVGTVVSAAVGTEAYHLNTIRQANAYRSGYEAEQQAADMDRRVEKLIEKHRKRQRMAGRN